MDDIIDTSIDNDAVGAGDQNARFRTGAINRHRFGDGDATETAGIDAIDFATGSGFGNSTGEGFARRGAAAGIGVIPDTRNPRPGRLGLRQRGRQDKK